MTRIEKGIEINEKHMYHVLNDIPEEVSFADQILALGYQNLEEFFEEKAVKEMQDILKGTETSTHMMDLLFNLSIYIKRRNPGIISIYTDETCVCHGNNTEKILNKNYCIEHNIPIYPYDSFGGNIVATKEDYGIAILIPTSIDVSFNLVTEKIINLLKQYYEDVQMQGNDILINGKKVIGSGVFGDQELTVMLFYFSMSDKGELISAICGEPVSDKTPGYIDIITGEQVRKELLSWLQGL